MKISGLHVQRFRHWQGLSLQFVPDGVTVVFGPNEAGKSTLRQFMGAVLYGFPPSGDYRDAHAAAQGGQWGGALEVVHGEDRFVVTRFAPPAGCAESPQQLELVVHTPDGTRSAPEMLEELLAGVDEATFVTVFALGLRELDELHLWDDSQAAEQLYGLATFPDRVALITAVRHVREQQHQLFPPDGQAVLEWSRRRRAIRRQWKRRSAALERWLRLKQQRNELEGRIRDIEASGERAGRGPRARRASPDPAEQTHELVQRIPDVQLGCDEHADTLPQTSALQKTRQQWNEARKLQVQLQSLVTFPDGRAHGIARLEKLTARLQRCRSKCRALMDERKRIQQRIRSLPSFHRLARYRDQIEELIDARPQLVHCAAKVQTLQMQIEEVEFELRGELERLGHKVDDLTRGTIESLQTIRRLVRLARQVRRLARDRSTKSTSTDPDHGTAQTDSQQEPPSSASPVAAETLEQPIANSANGATDYSDLVAARHRLHTQLKWLGRRLELDAEIGRLQAAIDTTRQQKQQLLASQVPTPRLGLVVGAIFALGTMLFLSGACGGWLGLSVSNRWVLAMVGGSSIAIALLVPKVRHSLCRRPMERCHRELASLIKHLDDARVERQHITQRLSESGDSGTVAEVERQLAWLDQRLSAEQPRASLDALARVSVTRGPNTSPSVASRPRCARVSRPRTFRHVARRRWRRAMEAAGLPAALKPRQLLELARPECRFHQLLRQRMELGQQRFQLTGQLHRANDQVQGLLRVVPIDDPSEDMGQAIDQLATCLTEYTRTRRMVRSLKRKQRAVRRRQQQLRRAAHRLTRGQTRLARRLGIASRAEIPAVVDRYRRAVQLAEDRDRLLARVAQQLGAGWPASTLKSHLAECPDRLEQEFDQLEDRARQADAIRKSLHQQLESVDQHLDQLVGQWDQDLLALEMRQAEHERQTASRRWQVLAVAQQLLEQLRREYEVRRQPELLNDASQLLEQLTCGRYSRIWIPLDEQCLRVNDLKGTALTVQTLSRGTREQLYLAIRLAQVKWFARRGAQLPLILDDVLVNFDRARMIAAAATLCQFAQSGHQVLVFTCHEHMRDALVHHGAHVVSLPASAVAQSRVGNPDPTRMPDPHAAAGLNLPTLWPAEHFVNP